MKEKAKPKAEDQTAASYVQGQKPEKAKEDRKCYCFAKLNCVPFNCPDKKKSKSEWASPEHYKSLSQVVIDEESDGEGKQV